MTPNHSPGCTREYVHQSGRVEMDSGKGGFYKTPSFFMHLVRRLPEGEIGIAHVAKNRRWHGNPWLNRTKSGSPYMVLVHGTTMFSVSRVRENKHSPWFYLMRWPFPAARQKSARTRDPDVLIHIIMEES